MRDLPLTGGVTAIARCWRANVIYRFAARSQRIMAAGALLGRTNKLTVFVTRFALHGDMRPGERETGLEVIKIASDWLNLGRRGKTGKQKCRQNDKQRPETLPEQDISLRTKKSNRDQNGDMG
jgi:hypothetical protein